MIKINKQKNFIDVSSYICEKCLAENEIKKNNFLSSDFIFRDLYAFKNDLTCSKCKNRRLSLKNQEEYLNIIEKNINNKNNLFSILNPTETFLLIDEDEESDIRLIRINLRELHFKENIHILSIDSTGENCLLESFYSEGEYKETNNISYYPFQIIDQNKKCSGNFRIIWIEDYSEQAIVNLERSISSFIKKDKNELIMSSNRVIELLAYDIIKKGMSSELSNNKLKDFLDNVSDYSNHLKLINLICKANNIDKVDQIILNKIHNIRNLRNDIAHKGIIFEKTLNNNNLIDKEIISITLFCVSYFSYILRNIDSINKKNTFKRETFCKKLDLVELKLADINETVADKIAENYNQTKYICNDCMREDSLFSKENLYHYHQYFPNIIYNELLFFKNNSHCIICNKKEEELSFPINYFFEVVENDGDRDLFSILNNKKFIQINKELIRNVVLEINLEDYIKEDFYLLDISFSSTDVIFELEDSSGRVERAKPIRMKKSFAFLSAGNNFSKEKITISLDVHYLDKIDINDMVEYNLEKCINSFYDHNKLGLVVNANRTLKLLIYKIVEREMLNNDENFSMISFSSNVNYSSQIKLINLICKVNKFKSIDSELIDKIDNIRKMSEEISLTGNIKKDSINKNEVVISITLMSASILNNILLKLLLNKPL